MRQNPAGLSRVQGVDSERLNNIYDAFNGCKYAGERHVCLNIAKIKTQEVYPRLSYLEFKNSDFRRQAARFRF